MTKILVFDGGCGGEKVAEYIEEEMPIMDIESIWGREISKTKTKKEFFEKIENKLLPYIYKVDVIVLGGWISSMALGFLKNKYPDQNFVGMECDLNEIKNAAAENFLLIQNKKLQQTWWYKKMKHDLRKLKLIMPDCSGWNKDDEKMIKELNNYRVKNRVESLVIFDTDFWEKEEQMMDVLGRHICVIDFREKLIKNLEQSLKLNNRKLFYEQMYY